MRLLQPLIASATLLATAALALEINDYPKAVEAGKKYSITYSPISSTATTFILRKGDANALDKVATLTESAKDGEFQWIVDSSLANADDYCFEIKQDGVGNNYSGFFSLVGGSG